MGADFETGYRVSVCGAAVGEVFQGSQKGLSAATAEAQRIAGEQPATLMCDGEKFDVVVTVDQMVNRGSGWVYFGEEGRFPGSKQ